MSLPIRSGENVRDKTPSCTSCADRGLVLRYQSTLCALGLALMSHLGGILYQQSSSARTDHLNCSVLPMVLTCLSSSSGLCWTITETLLVLVSALFWARQNTLMLLLLLLLLLLLTEHLDARRLRPGRLDRQLRDCPEHLRAVPHGARVHRGRYQVSLLVLPAYLQQICAFQLKCYFSNNLPSCIQWQCCQGLLTSYCISF